jgi:ABC-type glycerol-3-phosphate transport system permease component
MVGKFMFKKYKKLSKQEKISRVILTIVFGTYTSSFFYTFYWAISSSLKSNIEFLTDKLGIPSILRFDNFLKAFSLLEYGGNNMFSMIFNSVWLTVFATTITVFVTSMTAYVVAKYNFIGKQFIYNLAIFIMIIPIVGALPAQYKLINDLNIYDTPFILIMFTSGFGFTFLILYAYFKNLSTTYMEAASIDGASHYRIFFNVMLPQAMPSIMSIAVVQMIGVWNDYTLPIIYLPSYPTLASGLFSYQTIAQYNMNWPVYFAGILISMLPMLVIFAIFQNTIMENMVTGGIKG